ncbi:unnamed protein product, partial [marine sediment metagenome]
LSAHGEIVRSHGGAIYSKELSSTIFEPEYDYRAHSQTEEKRRVATVAAQQIKNGQSIILDSGSATLEVAKCIKDRTNLTVVTNDIRIGMELSNISGIKLVITGGVERKGFYTLIGPHAESLLEDLSVNTAILGAYAINESGISTVSLIQVGVKRKIIQAAQKVIIVADYSKFGTSVFARVCSLDEIDEIITDDKVDPKYREYLEKRGNLKITIA